MLERRVLVVSQDIELYRSIRGSIHDSLTDICRTTSAVDVLNTLVQGDYSLIIIDIPSLEKDSLELLRIIRKTKPIPILTLVEEAKPADKVALFHAGANACLEKPLDWTVCAAQADVLIQLYLELNQTHEACCPLTFGMELVISPLYRQVIIDGSPIELTRTEFDLLFCLAQHPGQVWSRSQLYGHVWADDLGASGDNTVRAHIGNLRKKLADVGKDYIQTSRGIGYKFVPPAAK